MNSISSMVDSDEFSWHRCDAARFQIVIAQGYRREDEGSWPLRPLFDSQ